MKESSVFLMIASLFVLLASCGTADKRGSAAFEFDAQALRAYRAAEKVTAAAETDSYLSALLQDEAGRTVAYKSVPVSGADTVEIAFDDLETGIRVKALVIYYEETEVILSGESAYFEIPEESTATETVTLEASVADGLELENAWFSYEDYLKGTQTSLTVTYDLDDDCKILTWYWNGYALNPSVFTSGDEKITINLRALQQWRYYVGPYNVLAAQILDENKKTRFVWSTISSR